MKKIKQIIVLSAFLLVMAGCDKGFEEINTDPFAISEIDPELLFAGSQRTTLGGWEQENTIVQQFVNPFNDGATLGFNFNADIDLQQVGFFDQYTGSVRIFVHILHLIENMVNPEDYTNLQSIVRIWKAKVFMDIVDHYGDVPYFNAGLAAILGDEYFYPDYDDDAAIYDDLYIELKESIAALNPDGDYVSADLFYGSHAYYPKADAAAQVAQWKKLGNSLLLRLGMRYSKLNTIKAATIVSEAFSGGVMTSNADNAFVVYDGTLFTNTRNTNLANLNPKFYYAAEPFVNQLKTTNDPRSKYLVATFLEPNDPLGSDINVDIEDQFGAPVGVLASALASPPYRGIKGGGYDYSQINVHVVASVASPSYWFTYAQTSLLLAEAAHRGWITGGETVAKQYYEDGVKADMDNYSLYLSETGSTLPAVTAEEQAAYLAQPGVAYNATDALKLINTQYWIACITDSGEGWANFRRSGFPALNRNTFDGKLLENGGDGYVHRFTYPDSEASENKAKYEAAVAAMGGIDNNVARVFWDIP